jgi:hypothetical protein
MLSRIDKAILQLTDESAPVSVVPADLLTLADNADKVILMLMDIQTQVVLDGLSAKRASEALGPIQHHLFRISMTLRELACEEPVEVKRLEDQ